MKYKFNIITFAAGITIFLSSWGTSPSPAEIIKIMAANITSGSHSAYEGPGINIFQGLRPDIVMIQEFNYNSGSRRDLIDTAFGTDYYFCVGPRTGASDIPNGVVSRWPIKSSGWWNDTWVSNREFVWAVIDLPGEKDLQVVSVHLLTSSSSNRDNEANQLKNYVQTNFDDSHYIVVGGDLNTDTKSEACIITFNSFLHQVSTKMPMDRLYDFNTSEPRSKPYDWVMPNQILDSCFTALTVGSWNYPNGIVFDSHVFNPLSEVSPVQYADSHVSGMQHMAVMKAFDIPVVTPSPVSTPTPSREAWVEDGDYDGDDTSDIAVFRPSSGLWSIRALTRLYFGDENYIPVPGDYNGDGSSDPAVFRWSSGLWAVRDITRLYYGNTSDRPVPADYTGDGTAEAGILRGKTGLWSIRGISRIYFGSSQDEPVAGDFNGDGTADIAIFRGGSGLWSLRGISHLYFGNSTDRPLPRDYSGDGTTEVAVFRSAYSLWIVTDSTRVYFGNSSDLPVPADYTGDSNSDIGIFRGGASLWSIRGISQVYYGSSSDIPVTR